ncbi:LexA family transcriptional regulator [Acetobacterium wieringae]|uniref:LexA family transcriptional regulator n=1 Tax=Acetobacterium wieringae TaxID=52694 RepID=UPI002033AE53|nr:S24 family peptidase [Acetobacterium wieringae]URN84988.1 helix-turn-helix domain-containing protein [Acetobacterium wieringae]
MKDRLNLLRKTLKLNQNDFGKKLGVTNTAISKLEKGERNFTEQMILSICREFNVSEEWLKNGTGEMFVKRSPALSQFEQIIEDFDLEDLVKVREFMDMLIKVKEGSKIIQIRDHIEYISRPLYDLPASAGNGQFLDSSHYEMMDFPAGIVPPDSTFCVRVAGNSMEPNFYDKDVVFVKQIPVINSGEIGVFVLNGEGFIKKYVCEGENCSLVSLNPAYEPIVIKEADHLKVVGKVVEI